MTAKLLGVEEIDLEHALYQNFLYGDLVNKRRVMLHQQAGEQLLRHYGKRAPQIATQLAIHFEQTSATHFFNPHHPR